MREQQSESLRHIKVRLGFLVVLPGLTPWVDEQWKEGNGRTHSAPAPGRAAFASVTGASRSPRPSCHCLTIA